MDEGPADDKSMSSSSSIGASRDPDDPATGTSRGVFVFRFWASLNISRMFSVGISITSALAVGVNAGLPPLARLSVWPPRPPRPEDVSATGLGVLGEKAVLD